MKTAALTLLLALLAGGAGATEIRFERSAEIRDAATHDQLAQKLRMAQQDDPLRKLGKAIGKVDEDPSKRVTERDLIKDSTILSYRGVLTLLPKRAVLYTPPSLKSRLEIDQKAKVLGWKDFYASNRGWIRTVEVTREQAMGQAPMSEEVVKAFETGNTLVVATFKGGPISVMPYVAPEEGDAAGSAPTAQAKTTTR